MNRACQMDAPLHDVGAAPEQNAQASDPRYAHLLELQRSAGNQAVGRLLSRAARADALMGRRQQEPTTGEGTVAGRLLRSKTKTRQAGKGPAVIEIATVQVLRGDTPTTLMIRALLQAYGGRGMTDKEALKYALAALAEHPSPGKPVTWKSGEDIPVRLNARSKQFLDRKYAMRAAGIELDDPQGPAIADGGEGGATAEGSRRAGGTGEAEDETRRGEGNPEGSEGGIGAPGDEGVLQGGVSREAGGETGGRVGAEPGGAHGGRRGGEGKEGDEGVRGALAWFPLINVSEYWAPLVEVALILADAGAFDGAFSKLMKVGTRAVRSELKREAREFAKRGADRLAHLLEEGGVISREASHIKQLAAAQKRAHFYKEIAERAEAEHVRLAKLVDEGGANKETLKNLSKQRDQAARIEREARTLHLEELDDANKLRGRDVTTGDPKLDGEIEEAIGEAERPAVKGGKRPTVEGTRVPTKKGERLDIDDLRLRPAETQRKAVARVRRVIGQPISDTPLARAWEAAREEVLAGRTIESLGQRRMNKEIYPQVRDRFWRKVREDGAARQFLARAGFDLGDSPAPLLRVTRDDLPVEQIRVSVDHSAEKAFEENWLKAIDADNLVFEFQDPNAFREIVQVRHKLGRHAPSEGG
jgi:hypothetical protein